MIRLILVGAILLAEYLFISFKFDAQPIRASSRVLGYAGQLGPLVLVTICSLLLLRPARRHVPGAPAARVPERFRLRDVILFALHVAAFTLFWLNTNHIFGDPAQPVAESAFVVSWFGLLVLVLAPLALLVLPRARLAELRAIPGVLAACVAVGVLAWLAGLGTAELWGSLAPLTMAQVELLLRPFYSDLQVYPATQSLGTPQFEVQIAPVCSGYEGIGLTTVLVGAELWMFRKSLRWPFAWLLLPIAIATVWIGNGVRIALLVAIGSSWSPEVALGGFHSKAGWLIFSAVALAIGRLLHSPWFSHERELPPRSNRGSDASAELMPLLAITAVAMLTGAFSAGFDRWYVLRIVAGVIALWWYREFYRKLRVERAPLACAIGALGFVVWLLLARGGDTARFQAELARFTPGMAAAWVAIRCLGSTLIVPLAEELAFRSFLWTELRRKLRPLATVLVSGIAFGLLHHDIVAAALVGVLYGLVRWRSDTVLDAALAHAVTNGLLAVHAVVTGDFRYFV